jgi:hypothetical protein
MGLMGLLLGLVVIVLTILEPAWYGWLIAVVLLSSATRRLLQYHHGRADLRR